MTQDVKSFDLALKSVRQLTIAATPRSVIPSLQGISFCPTPEREIPLYARKLALLEMTDWESRLAPFRMTKGSAGSLRSEPALRGATG